MSILGLLTGVIAPSPAFASHTTEPATVTLVGSLQQELGCSGDWDPACAATHLAYDAADGVWQGTWSLPAGTWEYKAALNNSWDENYGANATANGGNLTFTLDTPADVKFYYDHKSHWITSRANATIATVPGSFQSELGCPGDWQPDCLRSWLQDPDGDGTYTFATSEIPAGNYEAKAAINESWDLNYGEGGAENGANILFNVPAEDLLVTFTYNATTHILDIEVAEPPETVVTLVGDLQSELACSGDWDPGCAATDLAFDEEDDVYQGVFNVPAGGFEYKVALDRGWDENYGRFAQLNGPNIPLTADGSPVKFYYDHKSHWITSNRNAAIAVAPGNFQSELGCAGDWDPGCLRSWLQDPDEDGIYTFETTTLPAGNYEGKVALNESWDENYGQGGIPNGANIAFSVPFDHARVTFRYDAGTHVLTILSGFGEDNNIAWDGLRHDSRDTLYRTPGGAVPAGTDVLLRFRTFRNDVTGVSVRFFDLNAGAQRLVPMSLAAADVPCYQAGLESFTCDFWQVELDEVDPNNLWYRFIITDGSDTDYYADNTAALDGGLGSPTEDPVDNSYALMFYDPAFTAPAWAQSASIYQIFPDRFRDGRANNNPKTGDIRYDDPVLKLPWGTLPEGYCRNYADAATNCPWRFDTTPPDWSPEKEGPRGRDYFGGDLMGVSQNLNYLKSLGVNTIYFNPIFDAGSNHGYDTQDFYKIDPYFGTQQDWANLVRLADQQGIRIVLDGVFNHLSSDSPIFDRYQHYTTVGACESLASPYRSWFTFHDVTPGSGACVGSTGVPNSANYDGWFGFDSIPVINKNLPEVQQYFLTGQNSVSRYWLQQGASGWRMDVSGDPSFPNGYWETFRDVTKSTDPESLLISETWQKDSTLLRMLRGDRLDTTMNYRLRDAVIGFLAPQPFDSKGFADSGRIILPSEFAARLESVREDYPDAAYYSLMNLLDSHDTERLLWTLTPGSETRADKEQNTANVAEGKLRQRLASLIQFTVPGAPTVFYGDEVALTGDDDPDDRRTYPWPGPGTTRDLNMLAHYQTLNTLRRTNEALVQGDFRALLADDESGLVAFGRKTNSQAAIIIINRSNETQSGEIPVDSYLPDGVILTQAYLVGTGGPGSVTVANGAINGSVGPMSAVILLTGSVDLAPPAAPSGLQVTEEVDGSVSLAWTVVPGAAGYNVYRSFLSGGGWERVNGDLLTSAEFTDEGLQNARPYYYVVTALDGAGNESAYSNEVSGLPQLTINWANLQWPPTLTHTISVTNRTENVYGQVYIEGVTSQSGSSQGLRAQLGFGPDGSDPAGNADWAWIEASFNTDAGNNDEFVASLLPEAVGTYDYAYRYSTSGGRDWLYADLDGTDNGYSAAQAGSLTVNPSNDTTPPAAPAGLEVLAASPAGVELEWDAVEGDASLYGYEILRSGTSGGPYTQIARVTGTSYTDTSVVESATYFYVVRALDSSFNRSGSSNEVQATAELRTVTVMFSVTVPDTTDATGRSVYIAGFLDRLDGNLPQWDPGGVVLSRVDATHWTITLTGKEGVQIEYKYALGSWDFVEKDGACAETSNRQLTLNYGTNGTQIVNDTVPNWRNVAPCGN
ncbi:MAG TPA: alpha-amylase family glycosyl hydrolase [Anaerolineales bacterium]|nr:alpha-amylase family glycosyl hydrolase [Anaerolineales bacterium]